MQAYEVLEQDWGKGVGREGNTVVCNTGTAALHLALEALQLPTGSEVLVPDFTFIACARAVTLAGLRPVFIDCRDDLNLDPGLIEEAAVGHNVSAIMAVHIYGRPCDMSLISIKADYRGLAVIEDMAELHGVSPFPHADAACWSFYRNKIICGEEGGAIAFKTAGPAHHARLLRSLGYEGGGNWTHIPRGHNYRMTNAQAEMITRSYLNSRANIGGRAHTLRLWNEATPADWMIPAPILSPWMYTIRIPKLGRARQTKIVAALRDLGARPGFYPMSTQKEYIGYRRIGGCRAMTLSQEVIALPIWRTPIDATEEMSRERIRNVFKQIEQLI